MPKKRNKDILKAVRELMGDEALAETLAESLIEQRGSLGFLLETLRRRPKTFSAFVLKGTSVLREPSSVDRKTAELVAVGAATALACEHCLDAHMTRAMEAGAEAEEIMDAILIAASISESSALSVAFRKYRQLEGKLKKKAASG
jgi:AhpD family alkylhydroperoxidase